MSLLMKALEKAAKDRGEPRNQPASVPAAAPAAPPARNELSLEPMASPSSAPSLAPAGSAPPPPPPGPAGRSEPLARPAAAAPRTTGARPLREEGPAQAEAQAQASTVLHAQSASRPPASGIGAYARSHPLAVFGTLAGLVALGFGIYVYLQIFHPGIFVSRPIASPKAPLPPLTQAPAVPAPPVPATPLPSGPLLKEAAEAPAAAAPQAPRPKARPSAPVSPQEEAPRSAIAVSSGNPEPALNPVHAQAYAALRAGDAEEARRLYGQLLDAEPRNVQALLGLAAIAAQRGETEEASRRYLRILELEPRNALAQSGLIALLGRADPQAAESRLKQLIAREPTAHLHFTLGNLYADQSQWAAAQQSYFQAHHLDSANPDYAYNLAVALEHVGQPKLALGFYRRALQLAAARGRANFNLAQAEQRLKILAQRVE